MSSSNKTAILVIHGVGPHERYQACDVFARGFLESFKEKEKNVKEKHVLKPRNQGVQSCISLYTPGKSGCIDCYEYFWDIYMVQKVSPSEGWDMLVKASKNAKRFYKDVLKNREVASKVTDEKGRITSPLFRRSLTKRTKNIYKKMRKQEAESDLEFKPNGYLRLFGGWGTIVLVTIIPYIGPVVSFLEFLSTKQIPIFTQVYGVLSSIIKTLAGVFKNQLEKAFMRDLVVYLDMDPRSNHYETRQKIINGAVDELSALMEDNYDQIIIAGHSLGSVIAYDALNRLITQINSKKIDQKKAEKIIGLVTFGSPLDKIAFFFNENVTSKEKIRRKILSDIHTFRTLSLIDDKSDIDNPDPFWVFPEVRWLNFWHPKDMISGKLDLYDLSKVQPKHVGTPKEDGTKEGNIKIEANMKFLAAHGCYWGVPQGKEEAKEKDEAKKTKKKDTMTNQMQKDIIKEFFS
jgi:hypothetical protein